MDAQLRRWLTVSQTAELLQVHPKSVYLFCRQRRLTHVRLPSLRGGRGQLRIDGLALNRMLEDLSIPVADEPLDRRRRA